MITSRRLYQFARLICACALLVPARSQASASENIHRKVIREISNTAHRIDRYAWNTFYNPATQNLRTTVTGDLQDNTLYGGFYLASLVDAFAVTADHRFVTQARSIFEGLIRNATISGVPGFIARASRADSTYLGEPSIDQYQGLLYGLWKYFDAPFATNTERKQIRRVFADILEQLEHNHWVIMREDGLHQTKWGAIDELRPGWVLLSFWKAGYAVTGDAHWNELYKDQLGRRLPSRKNWMPDQAWVNASWVAIQTQVCLDILVHLEQDEQIRAKYKEAMIRLATSCIPQTQFFNEVPSGRSDPDVLAPYYIRGPKTKYVRNVRIPLEAVTVILLANYSDYFETAFAMLKKMNGQLLLERCDYTTTVVPWVWNNWLLLRFLKKQ